MHGILAALPTSFPAGMGAVKVQVPNRHVFTRPVNHLYPLEHSTIDIRPWWCVTKAVLPNVNDKPPVSVPSKFLNSFGRNTSSFNLQLRFSKFYLTKLLFLLLIIFTCWFFCLGSVIGFPQRWGRNTRIQLTQYDFSPQNMHELRHSSFCSPSV